MLHQVATGELVIRQATPEERSRYRIAEPAVPVRHRARAAVAQRAGQGALPARHSAADRRGRDRGLALARHGCDVARDAPARAGSRRLRDVELQTPAERRSPRPAAVAIFVTAAARRPGSERSGRQLRGAPVELGDPAALDDDAAGCAPRRRPRACSCPRQLVEHRRVRRPPGHRRSSTSLWLRARSSPAGADLDLDPVHRASCGRSARRRHRRCRAPRTRGADGSAWPRGRDRDAWTVHDRASARRRVESVERVGRGRGTSPGSGPRRASAPPSAGRRRRRACTTGRRAA